MEWLFFVGRDFSPASAVVRLLAAALFGCIIGIERGRHGRAAGMRTHILVCLGASLSTLVGLYSTTVLGYPADPLRVAAQVISGIGFLGAGTILVRERFEVTGLTTAAGLWSTASIGVAIGIGFYEAALIASLLAIAAMALLPKVDRVIRIHAPGGHIYVELSDIRQVNDFAALLVAQYGAYNLKVVPAASGFSTHLGMEFQLAYPSPRPVSDLCNELLAQECVVFAIDCDNKNFP